MYLMDMRGFKGHVLAGLACAAMLLAIGAEGADKKKSKHAVAEMRDLKVTLHGTEINVDGTVHNAGERTIERLTLWFHFFDTEHKPVTTLKLDVDDETLDPDEDAEIHAAANEPPRAVSMEVTAADRGERDLKVVNPGPYRIE
jgi:hypothetical protein